MAVPGEIAGARRVKDALHGGRRQRQRTPPLACRGQVDLGMGEAATPQIIGLVRDDMPLRDKLTVMVQRFANMPGGGEPPPVGKPVEPDCQRAAGKARDIGRGDFRQWRAAGKDKANRSAAQKIAGGKVEPGHDARAFPAPLS